MKPPLFFAGPCVLESRDHALKMAERIRDTLAGTPFTFLFKASFDKANRTSIASYRGPGLVEGLAILAEVKREIGVPVITDIHLPEQAEPAAEVVDVIQIPAFLCRQTDLIVAAARTGKPINIKKGQFMAPKAMGHAVTKAKEAGGSAVYLTERGTFLGYGDLVVDFRSLLTMRPMADGVIYDATHSVQQPGGEGSRSGGKREFILPLARAAAAVGVDGFFLEVHDDPDNALSDAASQLSLEDLPTFVREILSVMEQRRP